MSKGREGGGASRRAFKGPSAVTDDLLHHDLVLRVTQFGSIGVRLGSVQGRAQTERVRVYAWWSTQERASIRVVANTGE